ncbi:MAG: hypothetical protein E4H00_07150 [Myxococcales bacterium]|nr:MAG: hypothetical protein E4H00_07150 [Myxococcales bacterium]
MVAAIVAIQQLHLGAVQELVLSVAAGAVVYAAALYLLAPMLVRELHSKVVLMLSRQPAP